MLRKSSVYYCCPTNLNYWTTDPCFHRAYTKFPARPQKQLERRVREPGNMFAICACFIWQSLSFQFSDDRTGTACGLPLLWFVRFELRSRRLLHCEYLMVISAAVAVSSPPSSLLILLWLVESTRHFFPRRYYSLDIFVVFGPFSVNPRNDCVWKSSRSVIFCGSKRTPSSTMRSK